MREFHSLKPEGLADDFDVEVFSEAPIVKVTESEGSISLDFTFPGFHTADQHIKLKNKDITFKYVNLKGSGSISESGKPLLPSFGRYVQIPFNSEYKIKVSTGSETKFKDIDVAPAQEFMFDGGGQEHDLEYNEDTYAKEGLYPEDVVKVDGPFEIDGYNSLLVHVRPLQYNPGKRELNGYGNIQVTIDISPATGDQFDMHSLDPSLNREAFGNFFVNPARGAPLRYVKPNYREFVRFWPFGPEFLIIYADAFKKAAEKLETWKEKLGIRTDIVPISTVGNDVQKIKAYIRARRKWFFSRLRYVLLLGDTGDIETEEVDIDTYGVYPSYQSPKNATDYYYSTSKDPANNNGYLFPWLSIGRIPVNSLQHALDVVDQIITYEKNPPYDDEYYRKMTFAAYFQDRCGGYDPDPGIACRAFMHTMEEIRDHLDSIGFDVERAYVSETTNVDEYLDGTAVPQEVKDAIVSPSDANDILHDAVAEGRLIVAHRDHGDVDGWVHPPFTNDDLDTVEGSVPSVFFSINCLTGHFDPAIQTESFAEKILRIKHAAPSLVAATRVSHTFRNDSLMKGLFDGLWNGILPTFPGSTASYSVKCNRLGDLLNYAKTFLPVEHSGNPSGIKDHFEIYHVIGDPTLHIWKNKPKVIRLWYKVYARSLKIWISECPIGNVLTLWHNGKMVKRTEMNSTSIVIPLSEFGYATPVIPLPPPRPLPFPRNRYSICFWAPGYRFRQVNLTI